MEKEELPLEVWYLLIDCKSLWLRPDDFFLRELNKLMEKYNISEISEKALDSHHRYIKYAKNGKVYKIADKDLEV